MKIIRKRQRVDTKEYAVSYHWNNNEEAGFAFPCDKDGNVNPEDMAESGRANYEGCITGQFDVTLDGVAVYLSSYTAPAVGLCHCGGEVELYDFTNECERCGQLYNMSGQELVPRYMWEEPWNAE